MGTYRQIRYDFISDNPKTVQEAEKFLNDDTGNYFALGEFSESTKWYRGDEVAAQLARTFDNLIVRFRQKNGVTTDEFYYKDMVVPTEKLFPIFTIDNLIPLIIHANTTIRLEKEEERKRLEKEVLEKQRVESVRLAILEEAKNKLTPAELQVLSDEIRKGNRYGYY